MYDLIVLVPDHCFSVYFIILTTLHKNKDHLAKTYTLVLLIPFCLVDLLRQLVFNGSFVLKHA